jgi:hypothetical protein
MNIIDHAIIDELLEAIGDCHESMNLPGDAPIVERCFATFCTQRRFGSPQEIGNISGIPLVGDLDDPRSRLNSTA